MFKIDWNNIWKIDEKLHLGMFDKIFIILLVLRTRVKKMKWKLRSLYISKLNDKYFVLQFFHISLTHFALKCLDLFDM